MNWLLVLTHATYLAAYAQPPTPQNGLPQATQAPQAMPEEDEEEQRKLERQQGEFLYQVREGEDEPRSIGSYAVRVYRTRNVKLPHDDFVAGAIAARDGGIVGLWVANLDDDFDLEVVVSTQSAGAGSYGSVAIFEFNGVRVKNTRVVEPEESLLEGYSGHDRFYVLQDKLFREFPRQADGKPEGVTRLEYLAREGKWALSTDDVAQ